MSGYDWIELPAASQAVNGKYHCTRASETAGSPNARLRDSLATY